MKRSNQLIRPALAFLAVAVWSSATDVSAQAAWPTNAWERSLPAEQGMNPAQLKSLNADIRSGRFGYIDRMVVVRNGYLVVDERYDQDYRAASRGRTSALGCGWESCTDDLTPHQWAFNYLHPDYHPYYRGRDVHSLQSVTKSVAVTVIGVAIQRGDIAGVDTDVLSFFEDYDLSGIDPGLRQATLRDLLTMTLGIEWHEQDRPLNETNTTLQLEFSDDWIQFTLDQPMDAAPGEKWAYSSGGSHLMSGVIKNATGVFIDDYARDHLFGPLGIEDFHWKTTPRGYPDTEGGLYLEALQLARIGYLYLNDGMWDGERLLPEGWVDAATARQVDRVNSAGWGYGYQWWRLDQNGVAVWAGLGFGGQFLLVIPDYQLIGVVNSWNLFDRPQAGILGPFLGALFSSVR